MTQERKLYPSEKQEKFVIRFVDGLRDRLLSETENSGRAINAEINYILGWYFDSPLLIKTFRDDVAAIALEGIMANPNIESIDWYEGAGIVAYQAADVWLNRRSELVESSGEKTNTKENRDTFNVRFLDDGMRDCVRREAEKNKRSMNDELNSIIGFYLDNAKPEKTLRDELSLSALKGILSNPSFEVSSWLNSVGVMAYEAADASILARSQSLNEQEAELIRPARPKLR